MFKRVLPLFLILLIGGCYHAQISTGAPASPQVIDQPWAHSFLAGLVPPSPVDASAQCATGVSSVETRLSFVNMVANVVTFSIYSPMHLRVVCAAGQDQVRWMPVLEAEDEPKLGPRLDRVPGAEIDPVIRD